MTVNLIVFKQYKKLRRFLLSYLTHIFLKLKMKTFFLFKKKNIIGQFFLKKTKNILICFLLRKFTLKINLKKNFIKFCFTYTCVKYLFTTVLLTFF